MHDINSSRHPQNQSTCNIYIKDQQDSTFNSMEISEPMVKDYLNRSCTSEDIFTLPRTTISLQE